MVKAEAHGISKSPTMSNYHWEVPYTLKFKDVYGSVREVSSSVFISDFKFYLDPDTDSGQIGNHYTNHKNPFIKANNSRWHDLSQSKW
ncbi:hypothetical protein J4731_19690 [Providencia rettgeri]|nr:hypothetical protein [Providencia rettgeri]